MTVRTSALAAARRSGPYAGRVAERYYNAGYGNRLMIDHGYVAGRYVDGLQPRDQLHRARRGARAGGRDHRLQSTPPVSPPAAICT